MTLLALIFACATILYSILSIYNISWRPAVELGFSTDYLPAEHAQIVHHIHPGSPAERAGLKPGDLVVKVAGQELADSSAISEIYTRFHPGDAVQVTLRRPPAPGLLTLNATFGARGALSFEASQASVALETISLGEEIADRIEAERRSAQEMGFAREVQNRLFPQKLPDLASLEYTGNCIPTRHPSGGRVTGV